MSRLLRRARCPGPLRPRGSSPTPAASRSSPICTGGASHAIVAQALTALHNLDHRGAAGAEPSSGDGAGITVQVPDEFLRAVVGFELPAAGAYAVGIAFLPTDADARADGRRARRDDGGRGGPGRARLARRPDRPGRASARPRAASCRAFRQLFLARRRRRDRAGPRTARLRRCARSPSAARARAQLELYFPSLSARTLVYKGMLTTDQLGDVLPRPDR